MKLCPRLILALTSVSCLASCTGPRLLNFPYDPSGRSLNSQFAEQNPAIAGRYIVFVSDRRNNQAVYLYDTVNRGIVELPGLNASDMVAETPTLSDDARYIAFTGTRNGATDIYLYDRTIRQLRNLTAQLNGKVRNPSISANGNAIAFESSATGQWDIVVYNRFGQPLEGWPTPPPPSP